MARGNIKIIYTGLQYDYGESSRGFSFEHYNFYETLRRLSRCEVIYFPYERVHKVGKKKASEELYRLVKGERPDIVFAVMFEDELNKEVIEDISRNTPTQTVAWFCDDHWRFDNYSKYWAPYFNWAVTTDSQAPAKYHKLGYKNIIKSQWACNHFLYKFLNLPKIYDVTFVGQPHGNRKEIIEKIKKAGINIKCWGNGWPNRRVSQGEMIKIFSQSKINLNLTKSSGGINPRALAGIFLEQKDNSIQIHSPQYWMDNLKSLFGRGREQIKGRNFEIPGCGGLLFTSEADNLGDYYESGKEIVIYKDVQDLINKIYYCLEHEKEREAIARAGYQRTLRDHTYEKRFNEIFKVIDLVQ